MDDPQALSRALDERRDDVELSPLTLTFRDPALERAYWEHFFDENRRALIIAYLIVVVFAVAFTPVEYALFPARYPSLWAVRFGVILPGLAAFAPVLFSPRVIARVSRRYIQELMVAGTMIVLVGLGLQSVIALDVLTESIVLYGGLVYFLLLMGVHCVLRLRFLYAGALGTFILAAGLAIILADEDGSEFALVALLGFGSLANCVGVFGSYLIELYARRTFAITRGVERERARAERLLNGILPESIAARLKVEQRSIAEGFAAVSVLFADIVGFTPLSQRVSPAALVERLNALFTAFDARTEAHGAEKIKTIGDAYMVAAGLPTPDPAHAATLARLALDLLATVKRVDPALDVRIGIHSGPVVAGVIGRRRLIYDLWGDTVNTAARMESHGAPGRIQISDETRALLEGGFALERRGEVEIKGKGRMTTWWLTGARARSDV